MKKYIPLFLFLIIIIFPVYSDGLKPITFDDFIKIKRLVDPRISPDEKWVAYVLTVFDKEKNTSNSDIYIVSVDGKETIRLTYNEKADYNPEWMPDGSSLSFVSTRDGVPQIWLISLKGGEPKKITNISTGVSGQVISTDGKYFLFSSEVYPGCKDDECNKKKEEEKEKSKVKAIITERLFFRYWNHWTHDKRSHLFIVNSDGSELKDLTPGDYDVPPLDLGSGSDYAFSPDGKEIAFVSNRDPVIAISTNNDIFLIPVQGGEPKKITENKANDNQPVYSPDGRYIAYRAMQRPGFEADRYRLMLYERKTGKVLNLTENFDSSIGSIVWSPDGKFIYTTCEDQGYESIFRISIPDGNVTKISEKSTNGNLNISPDGKNLVFTRQSINHPSDVYTCDADGKNLIQITDVNKEILSKLEMNSLEEFWFKGAGGDNVHGFLLKPPKFEPNKEYPMIYLIHGGPQGAFGDEFHYRWNAQMFASSGYVVVMVNFHGSTGYGQKFTDSISGDWGGKPFEDLMKGLDYVLNKYPFIDKNRIAAAGASYGGYMINWTAGHTDRFRCLVSHAGVFNLISKYGSTEELWFPEWEFKGTPWTNKEMYEKFSPHNYVKNFKTPTLVIHGELDFRVPVTEGLQMYTSLQRMGVPSKLVYFPDEGHFVTKPQNAELWWKTLHEWFKKWLK
ncbi:MAG: S9 family peptidase [Acidobacteriota bacterium]